MEDLSETEGEKEVGNQDRNRGKYDGLGGGPAHSLGTLAAIHTFVTADHGNNAAKNKRLDNSDDDVGRVRVSQHVVPRIGRVDSQQIDPHKVTGPDADRDGLSREQRKS